LKLRLRYVVLSYVAVLLLGFAFTRVGLSTWDSPAHLQYMRWLIGKWTGQEVPVPFETVKWYGPLWEYVLALFTGALWFLRDPLWVRHAVTFTLLPVTLVAAGLALRASGESRGTALLAVALLSSNIRFVGHSLLNVKDFPFACGYLLCTLLLWSLLNRKLAAPSGLLQRPAWLFVATLVAVVPYLLRAPVISHWLLLVGLCLWVALLESRDVPWKRKWWVALVPLTTGPLVVWVLWPTLWETGIRGLPESFGLFSKFTWVGLDPRFLGAGRSGGACRRPLRLRGRGRANRASNRNLVSLVPAAIPAGLGGFVRPGARRSGAGPASRSL